MPGIGDFAQTAEQVSQGKEGLKRLINFTTFFSKPNDKDYHGLWYVFNDPLSRNRKQPELTILTEAMSNYWLAEVAEVSDFYHSQKEEMVERGHRAFALAIAALATAGGENIDWKRLGTIAQEKGLGAEKVWSVLQERRGQGAEKYYPLRNIILESCADREFFNKEYKEKRGAVDYDKFLLISQGVFERFAANMGKIFDIPPEVHQLHIEEIRQLLIKYKKLPVPPQNS